jgi:uncharacterized protein (UPF0332 family)
MLEKKEFIMPEDKNALIKYRFDRCKETIQEAKLSLDNKLLHNAENRIYYAIYYIVSALALKFDFTTSKHTQLLGWFNKNIIHTEQISNQFGDIYKNAFENRQEADYDDMIFLEYENAKKHFEDMMLFVNKIEEKYFPDLNTKK